MKKFISVLLMITLFVGVMTACGGETTTTSEAKLSIVTTIFPEYDWVMNILGDKAKDAQVTMLLDNGVDLHSYQPTADDLVQISKCDLFVYVGGESDEWAEDLLESGTNDQRVAISLLGVLGEKVKMEEEIEGMQAEEEEEEEEADEHVWLSLRNAKVLTQALCEALSKLDTENAGVYEDNTKNYLQKLDALDADFSAATENAQTKTLLFADRFPFRYLVDDYGLSYYAAFAGCSAETEASFETVAFLAKKVDELKLSHVMTLEGSDGKIAQTVIATTDAKNATVLAMDSMQSATMQDVQKGVTYISIMEKNLDVLKQAVH